MKRWIHASTSPNVFDISSTGTSYYNNFLNTKDLEYMQTAKNLTGHIEMMTPQEYFEACAKDIFQGRHTAEQLKKQREASRSKDGIRTIDKYIEDMRSGSVFPLCFLNYADLGQEGLHRMYAAGEAFGWDTEFPVLIVEPYDMDRWNESQFWQAVQDYRRYDLKDVVKEATDSIADWDKPVPDNFDEIFREAIRESARNAEEPHDIDVQLKIDDGSVFIYLSSFDGRDVDSSSFDDRVWLEDMFDTESDDEDTPELDDEIDDLEIDDLDIQSYFFK